MQDSHFKDVSNTIFTMVCIMCIMDFSSIKRPAGDNKNPYQTFLSFRTIYSINHVKDIQYEEPEHCLKRGNPKGNCMLSMLLTLSLGCKF